jgi:hypothetical protein
MRKVLLEFNLPVSFIREDKRIVAYSPALDLSTSAKNYKEARRRFSEIVNIFFEELIKRDTLEEILGDLGWKKIQAKWIPPAVISQESQTIQVPIRA